MEKPPENLLLLYPAPIRNRGYYGIIALYFDFKAFFLPGWAGNRKTWRMMPLAFCAHGIIKRSFSAPAGGAQRHIIFYMAVRALLRNLKGNKPKISCGQGDSGVVMHKFSDDFL